MSLEFSSLSLSEVALLHIRGSSFPTVATQPSLRSISMALSKPLSVKGASSVKTTGGRLAKPSASALAATTVEAWKELDLRGDDSMPLVTSFTFKCGLIVEVKPDGRKCRTCPLRDDSYCPVSIKVRNIRTYVLWERPPHKETGSTVGTHCNFCCRGYDSTIKRSRVPHITFLEYEQQLANDVANLEKHQAMVFTIIKHIVQAGGNLSCHLDWAAVKDQTLTLQYKRSLVKQRPGWKHYAMSHYVDTFGSLETNGKLLCGHRRWELDGVDGVLVPDDAVTKIRYTEEIAAQLDMQARS